MKKPNYHRVDGDCSDEGYGYRNNDGSFEYVKFLDDDPSNETVLIHPTLSDVAKVYTVDIPKLILALQAAYDFAEREGAV
jgi:hypothetical protein